MGLVGEESNGTVRSGYKGSRKHVDIESTYYRFFSQYVSQSRSFIRCQLIPSNTHEVSRMGMVLFVHVLLW